MFFFTVSVLLLQGNEWLAMGLCRNCPSYFLLTYLMLLTILWSSSGRKHMICQKMRWSTETDIDCLFWGRPENDWKVEKNDKNYEQKGQEIIINTLYLCKLTHTSICTNTNTHMHINLLENNNHTLPYLYIYMYVYVKRFFFQKFFPQK